MKNLRKAIRKQLFKLFENYPAGTVNDPNAPWNQADPKFIDAKKPATDTYMPIFFNNEITILKNKIDGSKWVFYNETASKDDYFPYSGAEDKSVYLGNDEDGDPVFDEEYGEWDLNGEIVADYINDNLGHLKQGTGLSDYENGVDLVKVDQPLALSLIDLYKDDNLKKVLFLP